jgi:release factor glutamine methyltransferase
MTEAELLFSEVLGCDRASLYLNKDEYLGQERNTFIASVLKRRIKGEPLQYILEKTEFFGLELKVNRDVLIPRPETELLVEAAIQVAKEKKDQKILDLGTGSGCIAISLAKHLPHLHIDASDISDKALRVAKENAGLNGVKINFIQSDLFTPLEAGHRRCPTAACGSLPLTGFTSYDIIISNPPYIAAPQIRKLQPEIGFEPEVALNGGIDGLDFYRRLILSASNYLKKNGLLILEIGFDQSKELAALFKSRPGFEIIKIIKDYNNIDRIIVARKANQDG